jgi:hypothetical protein
MIIWDMVSGVIDLIHTFPKLSTFFATYITIIGFQFIAKRTPNQHDNKIFHVLFLLLRRTARVVGVDLSPILDDKETLKGGSDKS